MAELPTKEERFNEIDALEISHEIHVAIHKDSEFPMSYIVLRDDDQNGPTYLDVSDARALRDWLNEVLP